MTGEQRDRVRRFLFPGDGKEAVVIALCGRRVGDRRHRLIVREIHEVPYELCSNRTSVEVTWPCDFLVPLLDRATGERLSIVKLHSHPTGRADFSQTDDVGDVRLLRMIRGWLEAEVPHASAVMLPNGQMFGRYLRSDCSLGPIAMINVVGDDLDFWYQDAGSTELPSFIASHAQAFDVGTIERLRRLSIAVVGCSGTGSPVIEQLMRLGVGEMILVDNDRMEDRNVNRISNSTMQDAIDQRLKVDVHGDAIERIGLGTRVIRVPKNLWNPDAVREVAQSDIVIGCMDTIDGRYLLNTLATCYTLAYFDIGVRLEAVPSGANKGQIREVCGTVSYLQPGRSSLMSRGLFTMAQVAAAGLRRNDRAAHDQQARDGYIAGAQEHRPAVISVNMFAASLAVNELLARLHPYREEPNGSYAATTFSLASMELISEAEQSRCEVLANHVGVGDMTPLLGLLELAERRIP